MLTAVREERLKLTSTRKLETEPHLARDYASKNKSICLQLFSNSKRKETHTISG
jgi:hypothetical protein